jgi:hypothetical protein
MCREVTLLATPHALRLFCADCCSGFRLEPRLLQQYANMQQQSPMASVRIPPPVHDGGGLYNPFNAGPLGPPPPRDLSQQQQQQVPCDNKPHSRHSSALVHVQT